MLGFLDNDGHGALIERMRLISLVPLLLLS